MKKENKLSHKSKALIEQAKAEIEINEQPVDDEELKTPLKQLFMESFKPLNEREQKALLLNLAETYDFYDDKQYEAIKSLSKAKTNHQVEIALKDIEAFRMMKSMIAYYIHIFNFTGMDKELKKQGVATTRDFNFRMLFEKLTQYEKEFESVNKAD